MSHDDDNRPLQLSSQQRNLLRQQEHEDRSRALAGLPPLDRRPRTYRRTPTPVAVAALMALTASVHLPPRR